ncbi:TNF receptor-associated factor 3-like [Watersipora subatra]|uniref:TNF receptor-associated factor 3-like n=1 Tax=Watersipora subatra TaxID=2589382 RepID=UPI00355AD359
MALQCNRITAMKRTAELCGEVQHIEKRIVSSGIQGKHLLSSLKAVDQCQTTLDKATSSLRMIEHQWTQSGVANSDVVKSIGSQVYNAEFAHTVQLIIRAAETSYDGNLLVKIPNYSHVKALHTKHPNVPILSPGFYTSRYGYKMRLQVFLNGFSVAKGTHLSIAFALLPGPYDELLDFPFKQRVATTLLSPGNPNMNFTANMVPGGSAHFQKQKEADNLTVGLPRFILQSEVETDRYLKDDTIYFRCEVKPGGDTMPSNKDPTHWWQRWDLTAVIRTYKTNLVTMPNSRRNATRDLAEAELQQVDQIGQLTEAITRA